MGGLSEPLCPEMHRTQTRFEDAFTLKVFIFQFVNFYSSPIYIGFFKGRSAPSPGLPSPWALLLRCPNPCGPRGSGRVGMTVQEGTAAHLWGQQLPWLRASEQSWAPGPP